jgi:hypothetical protein
LQGKLSVLCLRDFNITFYHECLPAIIMTVEFVAIDAIRGISNDEINRIIRDVLRCPADTVTPVKYVLV